MDPLSILGMLGQAGQIVTSHLQAKNFLINSEMRAEQLKLNTLNHEQQLRMFYLQQNYKFRDIALDQINKMDQETYKSLLKIHEQRSIECKIPPYPLGKWVRSTITECEPAPYIIICTNTYQGDSPFKNEDVIKPLYNVFHSLKEYNSCNDELLTLTETRQYFNTDEDARNFFIRELQCPTILVYSTFIGSSLTINVLYAGVTNNQNRVSLNTGKMYFKPQIIRLWEMDYTAIYNLKSKKKTSEEETVPQNPFQWKKTLDNIIEAFVGIKVQSLIDEYFQNSYLFKPQSLQYLLDRAEKYGKKLEWQGFAEEIMARYQIISQRQQSLSKEYRENFMESDKVRIRVALIGQPAVGKTSLISAIVNQDVGTIACNSNQKPVKYMIPPFEVVEVQTVGFISQEVLLETARSADLHILVIQGEPYGSELETFDLLASKTSQITKIVFFNKVDHFEFRPRKDVGIIKQRVKDKMLKYVKDEADIFYGCAAVYDSSHDTMVAQKTPALNERIYKEVLAIQH